MLLTASYNDPGSAHYSSQAVDDDLLVLSRSSLRAANGQAEYTWKTPYTTAKAKVPCNNHDSNMITFHRVENPRSLALDLEPDFSATAKQ